MIQKKRESYTKNRHESRYRRFFLSLFVVTMATAVLLPLAFALTNFSASAAANGNVNNPVPTIVGNETAPISNDSDTAVLQENPDAALAPNESSALYDLIGIDASQPLEVVLLITVLSVAPSILLMMTSFTRIIIIFGFMRNAMQTPTTPPNQVLTGLALFLTLFIMWPVFGQINEVAYQPYDRGELSAWEAVEAAGDPIKDFMLKQTSNDNMQFFLNLQKSTVYTPETAGSDEPVPADITAEDINLLNYQDQLGFEVVIPAFMISELSRAFQMGFMLFIPFLIIDIVVSSTLMSMGMMMLPPAMISLPFKIMLFVLVDGWQLLIGSIITSYN